MVENSNTKHFGLLLIITAHIVFNDPGHAQVIGIIGQNITLKFTFNTTFRKDSSFAVYTTGEQKISDTTKFKHCFEVYPKNSSVFYHITNLTLNHAEVYWATLFGGERPTTPSDRVRLIILKENRSTTVPPMSTKLTKPSIIGSSSLPSSHVVTVLVALPVILSVALLPFLICCLVKPKDQQREEPQRGSNPTVQETIEEPTNVPGPSLVYSVLDFPKRLPAAVEFNPSGTEYATVSYLTEKRHRSHADYHKSPDRSRLK